MAVPELSSGILPPTFSTTYELLSPVIPNYARSLYYRGCWHELAGPSYSGTVIFFPDERALQPKGLLHSRGIAASEFPPLCKILHCCSRRSLGCVSVPMWLIILSNQLLITVLVGHYLTNKLIKCRLIQWCIKLLRKDLSGISTSFLVLFQAKGRYLLLTRLPLSIATSFDLHVLVPPAYVLSHDQTLKFKNGAH